MDLIGSRLLLAFAVLLVGALFLAAVTGTVLVAGLEVAPPTAAAPTRLVVSSAAIMTGGPRDGGTMRLLVATRIDDGKFTGNGVWLCQLEMAPGGRFEVAPGSAGTRGEPM